MLNMKALHSKFMASVKFFFFLRTNTQKNKLTHSQTDKPTNGKRDRAKSICPRSIDAGDRGVGYKKVSTIISLGMLTWVENVCYRQVFCDVH